MNRAKLNYIIDSFLFLIFLVVTWSGLVVWLNLAVGYRGGRGLSRDFLGLSRSGWQTIHLYSGLVFLILVLVHLILHWRNIKSIAGVFKT